MAGSGLKAQFLMSNPNGAYTTKAEKLNGTGGKASVKRLIMQSVSGEVQRLIEEQYKEWLAEHAEAEKDEKDAAKKKISTEVYSSNNAAKTAGRVAMKKQVAPVSLDGLGGDVEKKYQYAGTAFFRIVSRTPYDEDYVVTRHVNLEDRKKYRLKIVGKGIQKSVVLENSYSQHRADNDVVRNDWYIELINADGSSVTLGVKDFGGVSFENVTGAGWKAVSDSMKKVNGGKEIVDMNIFNMNQRCRQLEFGLYRTQESREFHKGAKRYHGVAGGYSVQAPRGFVRITQMELANAGRLSDEVPSTGREILRGKRKGETEEEPLGFSAYLPENVDSRATEIVADYFRNYNGRLFNEKDVLEAMVSDRMNPKLRTRKTAEQLREEARLKLEPKIFREYREEMDKEIAEMRAQIDEKERKRLEKIRVRQEKAEKKKLERQEKQEKKKKDEGDRRRGLKSVVTIDGLKDTKCVIPDEKRKKTSMSKDKKNKSSKGWIFGTVTIGGKKYCCARKGKDMDTAKIFLKPYSGKVDEDLSGYMDYHRYTNDSYFMQLWNSFRLGG